MNKMVSKIWAPPRIKFFAWLAIQNCLWTTDRLDKRGTQILAVAHFARKIKSRGRTSSSNVPNEDAMGNDKRVAWTSIYQHL
jgi:hypothetical protein